MRGALPDDPAAVIEPAVLAAVDVEPSAFLAVVAPFLEASVTAS